MDHFSFPFYYAIRMNLFGHRPFEDAPGNLDEFDSLSIKGLAIPRLTGGDHPNREYLATKRRAEVVGHILNENPDVTVEDLSDELRTALTEMTNAFWWIGFHAEFMLIKKLQRRKSYDLESAVLGT